MTTDTVAVLLMAYGSPETPEDVQPYFTHIRGGRTPSPEAVEKLRQRYRAVGGKTPLLQITREVARRLAAALEARGRRWPVHVGMKHWHPFIGDVLPVIAANGAREIVAIPLAPHYSRMSIGGYRRAVDEANAALAEPLQIRFVERWHDVPAFVAMMASLVREGLAQFPADARASTTVIFTAHSLPERIREWGDSYEAELRESAAVVSRAAQVASHRIAWQSAGENGERWIGPDIGEALGALWDEGQRSALIVPIGFVAEHLEIHWDLDHVAIPDARARGMDVHRTRLPNVDDALIDVLATIVESNAGALAAAAALR